MKAQHSSATDRWYTPLPIIGLGQRVLGPIDLDPASDVFGNSRVRAAKFYDERADGLSQPWAGTIWCNPPGGVRVDPRARSNRKVSNAGLHWRRLIATRESGHLTHAIFVAFSLELLQRTQRPGQLSCADFVCLLPRERVAYDGPDGEPGADPTHASAIVYVPGTVNRTRAFASAARALGTVIAPIDGAP